MKSNSWSCKKQSLGHMACSWANVWAEEEGGHGLSIVERCLCPLVEGDDHGKYYSALKAK